MTDAASKAREIVNQFAGNDPMYPRSIELDRLGSESLETTIAAAIESAVQAERERAAKLVDAAKAANRELGNLITSVHGLEDQGGFVRGAYRQTGYHERARTELDIALKAYEVPHE